ncbi:cell division protein FtsX [Dermatobacter hominis]|uniref:cell division protein FtsX n=1 Tax=Dermatobacter hominis TaxID=2884263 RepID=UPI001D10A4B4|nr:permease-like cell division protein FtsX [Dermatobacter hominis]UDY37303.1 permease-like cell division protein FtsX [Dermatobacter hominis]
MPDNDEQLTVDVVDEGFRPDGPEASDASAGDAQAAGVAVDLADLAVMLDTDDDRAITSFLTGEAAMVSLRERPWTRFASMAAYAFRDALRGIRRRPALAASAALTVSLCALLAGGAAIARAGVDATMARWADGVEFVVYLQPGATSSDIDRVGDELREADGVRDVTAVSQAEAFEEYQRLYADEATMVEAVTPDLLPPSFRVAPDDADPGLIQRITRPLASDPDIYQVVTADDAVQDVRDLSGAVSGFGTWLAVVLGVVGIVLSATMIRSSIASRQKEIDMMRSFGAGRSYIAAPVAIEGVLIGVIGAGVAAIGLAIAMSRATTSDSSVVTSLLPPSSEARSVVIAVFFVTVLVCTAVSVLTTANALRKAR